jgi:hypothetical protein
MHLNINKAIGLGVAVLTLTAGSAFAATVTTSGNLQVLSGPGDNYQAIGEITGEQSVSLAATSGDWCQITSPKAGWVPCAQLSGFNRTNLGAGFGTSLAPAPGSTVGPSIYDPKSDPVIAHRQNP